MDMPFFVAFSLLFLVCRCVPFALPPRARGFLAGEESEQTRVAKRAVSVAVGGLVLLVPLQRSGDRCFDVREEERALLINSAALFLGLVLAAVSAALPPFAVVTPFVEVAIDHLTKLTETITVTAFAHGICIFLKTKDVH